MGMNGVSRRGFFGRLAAAVCVGVAAPKLAPAAAVTPRPELIHDPLSGIAIRFIQQYDVHPDLLTRHVTWTGTNTNDVWYQDAR